MVSKIASRLIGEADASAGQEWFDSLSDDIKEFMLSGMADAGDIDNIEVSALMYLVTVGEYGTSQRVATWEEYQSGVDGDFDHCTKPEDQVTCYAVYAHQVNMGGGPCERF